MADTPSTLTVRIDDEERTLTARDSLVIGRGEDCDWVLADLRVSRRHLHISWSDGWYVRDLHSANGSFLANDELTESVLIAPGSQCALRIADPDDGPLVELAATAGEREFDPESDLFLQTRMVGLRPDEPIVIGRDADLDIALADPLVSRQHCRVIRQSEALVVTDLDSRNGTFVNGKAVTETTLGPGDELTVGNTDIDVDESGGLVVRSDATRTGLVLRDISYQTPEGKTLVEGVDLNAPPGTVIGVIGPSGAGKSTLMNVITGLRSPATGSASFEGHDIHAEYSSMKLRIGLVPQDDLVHRQLSVRQALSYAARLRLPADTDPAERAERVASVISVLGLAEHQDKPIKKLSGGQRKRASIGLELLTQPALLVLDEPTSGLDPNTARDLMSTLSDLASGGRTIVVVSHSPADLDQCDLVILLAAGGLMAGLAAPDLLLDQFDTRDWRDIYRDVSSEGGNPQAANRRYQVASSTSVLSNPPTARPSRRQPRAAPNGFKPQRRRSRQLATLVRRQTRLLAADRGYLIFLLLLPFALGVLALIVPGSAGFTTPTTPDPTDTEARQILVVLICGAAFAGLALSVRDLITERGIYERERAVGLRPLTYLFSKIIVLGALGAVQAAVLTGVVLAGKPGPPDPLVLGDGAIELFVAVLLTLWSSCALGLLISSLVRSNEQVMPVLVLTIMLQLVFCGGLIPISGRAVLTQIAWLVPSRWGFSAAADTVDLQSLVPSETRDAQWDHTTGQWFVSCALLLALALAFLILTWWRISERKQGKGRQSWRNKHKRTV